MWLLSNKTGSFSNDDGDGNEHVKKETCLLRKTTNLHVHHAFMYIFSLSLHDYDVKMSNFTFLGERIETSDDEFFSLYKLEWGLHEINSRGIRLHLTFSAHWNKRDKACKKKRFSLSSPSSLLKLPNKI